MKRTLVWILALAFLAPAAWAADSNWPAEMADVEALVTSAVGTIPYDRVEVRRLRNAIEVSIKLKDAPRQLRGMSRQKTEDDVFLAAPVIELFEPSLDLDIVGFDLLPIADIIDYYFGFAVFNFGKTIKLPAEITVTSGAGEEFSYTKKKYKMKKNRIYLLFTERGVSGGGLHELYVAIGPWNITSYFCVDC